MIENIFSARDFVIFKSHQGCLDFVFGNYIFQNGHSLMPYFIIPSPIIPAGMNVFMVSVMVLSIRSLT
mgnify:CR=1 FL=1